jgi:anti-sigma B factor antagonist
MPVGSDELELRCRKPDDIALVVVSGELDIATGPVILNALMDVVEGSTSVVVDLSGVPLCDARGLSSLLRAHNYASQTGTIVVYARPQPSVRSVLEITGLDQVLIWTEILPERVSGIEPRVLVA